MTKKNVRQKQVVDSTKKIQPATPGTLLSLLLGEVSPRRHDRILAEVRARRMTPEQALAEFDRSLVKRLQVRAVRARFLPVVARLFPEIGEAGRLAEQQRIVRMLHQACVNPKLIKKIEFDNQLTRETRATLDFLGDWAQWSTEQAIQKKA